MRRHTIAVGDAPWLRNSGVSGPKLTASFAGRVCLVLQVLDEWKDWEPIGPSFEPFDYKQWRDARVNRSSVQHSANGEVLMFLQLTSTAGNRVALNVRDIVGFTEVDEVQSNNERRKVVVVAVRTTLEPLRVIDDFDAIGNTVTLLLQGKK